VLDSRVGALDRTFGFIFGLARGFLLVAIVFILFTALARDQPDWVRNARSYSILQQTQVAIESLLPMNPEQYLPGTQDEQQEGQPGGQPEGAPGTSPEGRPEAPAEVPPDQPS
jgi:membrane protein required for colicin V production